MYSIYSTECKFKPAGPYRNFSVGEKGKCVPSFLQMRHLADLKCRQLVTWRTRYAYPPTCMAHGAGCPLGAARTAPGHTQHRG